jgi:vacuolar protein-sorting-associated protein 4
MDGVGANNKGVLIIAATNLPWELDQAMLRRFERRIYIPLPDRRARVTLIKNHLKEAVHELNDDQIDEMARATEGYSGADLATLIRDALMQPIREFHQADRFVRGRGIDLNGVERDNLLKAVPPGWWGSFLSWNTTAGSWEDFPKNELAKPVARFEHFQQAVTKLRPSTDRKFLAKYEAWTKELGENGI